MRSQTRARGKGSGVPGMPRRRHAAAGVGTRTPGCRCRHRLPAKPAGKLRHGAPQAALPRLCQPFPRGFPHSPPPCPMAAAPRALPPCPGHGDTARMEMVVPFRGDTPSHPSATSGSCGAITTPGTQRGSRHAWGRNRGQRDRQLPVLPPPRRAGIGLSIPPPAPLSMREGGFSQHGAPQHAGKGGDANINPSRTVSWD